MTAKVLVIDDDKGVRDTLSAVLKEEGYTVATSADGQDGLQRALDDEPQFVLCDLQVPVVDGLEFLERYRESDGKALVVMMGQYADADVALEAMRRGAYDWLPKPFTASEMILTLRKAKVRERFREAQGVA